MSEVPLYSTLEEVDVVFERRVELLEVRAPRNLFLAVCLVETGSGSSGLTRK